MKCRIELALLLTILSFTSAHAYESEEVRGYSDPAKTSKVDTLAPDLSSLTDGERLRKFNVAMDALKIPHEAAGDLSDLPDTSTVLLSEVQAHLKFIDFNGGLQRYLKFQTAAISLFQDYWTALLPQSLLDVALNLKTTGTSEDSRPLINHLTTIANQVKDASIAKPLSGLKVVIDPGHMGTDYWDGEGGKFVKVSGVKVSEGQINLWTTLLVANHLEALGATVVLTRSQMGAVAQTDPSSWNRAWYINHMLYGSIDDWMGKYLSLSDTDLASSIASKPEVTTLYSSAQRVNQFINGEDLEARSLIVDREQPDIVLDIHFDANDSTALQSSSNSLEAFVPGAFVNTETGSRTVREAAFKHLTEVQRWNESVALAGEITQSMSAKTKVPVLKDPSFMQTVKVQDGVYARNLYINRRNTSSLMVYLECLHYDYTGEFYNLAKNTEAGIYHGMSFSYPARLNAIADGISSGFVNYFKR